MIGRGLVSTDHPVLAHLVVTRRCNLACEYCSEYDHVSPPVPLESLIERVDRLAALGTSIVTISGGSLCCSRTWTKSSTAYGAAVCSRD